MRRAVRLGEAGIGRVKSCVYALTVAAKRYVSVVASRYV